MESLTAGVRIASCIRSLAIDVIGNVVLSFRDVLNGAQRVNDLNVLNKVSAITASDVRDAAS
jgi:hypothetical protein